MVVQASAMVREVRVAIDMNRTDKALINDNDQETLLVDDIILSKLCDAVRQVELECPVSMLEAGTTQGSSAAASYDRTADGYSETDTTDDSLANGADTSAYVEPSPEYTCTVDENSLKASVALPETFMRLVSFKMSSWSYAVHEAITADDPAYVRLQSRWHGISGSPERPRAAIVTKSTGRVLEGYSSASAADTVEYLVYRPLPKVDEDGGIDVSRLCYKPAVYRAAFLALATVGDPMATTMLEISKALLA
jgi:hypothetical protein